MTKLETRKNETKYFQIIPKADAHLQTMTKTSVLFLIDRLTTVRGVAYTRYLSTIRCQNHSVRNYVNPNTLSPHFSSKKAGNKKGKRKI